MKNSHKKFSNLAVNYSDVVFFSRRETLGMFIVVVPVVQWRRSGRGKEGGGLCCIHAAQNIGNTSFMLNVPNKEAVVRDTQLRDTWTDKNNKRNRFKRKRFDFRGWNYLKERKQSAGCSRAQRSQPWRGPWRQQQVPTPLEGRPPRLWHHTGGIWGMPCSWEKSSSFNGFPGATEVTKRRTKEVPLHIYVPPLFFCLLAADELESQWGNLFA